MMMLLESYRRKTLSISIEQIKGKDGLTMPVNLLLDQKKLIDPLFDSFLGGEILLEGEIMNAGYGRFCLTGHMTAKLEVPCDRCLTPVDVTISLPFEEWFHRTQNKEEKAIDIDNYFFQEDEITLDDAIKDNLLLQWPEKVLCQEDCKGLCPNCGRIRNIEQCPCQDQLPDDGPFAALKVLLCETDEEV